MTYNNDLGFAFEKWISSVMNGYVRARLTGNGEHFDVSFDYRDKAYLLECKCFSFLKGKESTNTLCIRPTQIRKLRERSKGLHGDNVVLFVVGVLFKPCDVLPVVLTLDEVERKARWKDKRGRRFIPMTTVLKCASLRVWIGEVFDVDPMSIVYPRFNEFLSREMKGSNGDGKV